eukprot:jgi/Botrbrau1/6918/Bobra.67_3s0035.1
MAAMDHLLGQLRGHQDPQMPPDCVARFLCTKHSWRGKYRRVLCITPTAIITQHIDTLAITNTWSFVGDSDVDGILAPPPSDLEEQDFTISARQDKKSKYKSNKFSSRQRGPLLSVLYQCMTLAARAGQCPIAAKVLGSEPPSLLRPAP